MANNIGKLKSGPRRIKFNTLPPEIANDAYFHGGGGGVFPAMKYIHSIWNCPRAHGAVIELFFLLKPGE